MPIILIFIGIFLAQMEYFVTYSLSLIFGQILDFLFLFFFGKKFSTYSLWFWVVI